MRQKLVVGNWKMNGSLQANQSLLKEISAGITDARGVAVAVCVPFPYLAQAQALLADTSLAWGAQNLSEKDSGAFTGEVAASMLRDFACCYVLVGHSERRTLYGENNALVAEKFAAALAGGLQPILCVGETLAERETGKTGEVIASRSPLRLTAPALRLFPRLLSRMSLSGQLVPVKQPVVRKRRKSMPLFGRRWRALMSRLLKVCRFFMVVALSRRMPQSYLPCRILMVG